jgi:hypothetical protein
MEEDKINIYKNKILTHHKVIIIKIFIVSNLSTLTILIRHLLHLIMGKINL